MGAENLRLTESKPSAASEQRLPAVAEESQKRTSRFGSGRGKRGSKGYRAHRIHNLQSSCVGFQQGHSTRMSLRCPQSPSVQPQWRFKSTGILQARPKLTRHAQNLLGLPAILHQATQRCSLNLTLYGPKQTCVWLLPLRKSQMRVILLMVYALCSCMASIQFLLGSYLGTPI